MIRTQEEYREASSFIDKDLELYDYDLSEKMSSLEYNVYLQDTQYYLNVLYEKMRSIEDMIEFLNYYTRKKFKKISETCDKAENFITTMRDYNESDKKYDSYTQVEWDTDASLTIYDRDGEPLNRGHVTNNNTILPTYNVVEKFIPESVTRNTNTEEVRMLPYSDNLENVIESGIYKVAYETVDNSVTKINDVIQFNFKDGDMERINSTVWHIFDSENTEIQIDYIPEKKTISVKSILKNFTNSREPIDIDAYTNSFLNKIDLNNDITVNTEKTISDNIEKIRKIYNENYGKKYLKEIENYQSTKKSQDKIASKNGVI